MAMHLSMINERHAGVLFVAKYCSGPYRRSVRHFIDGKPVSKAHFDAQLAVARNATEQKPAA